MNKNTSSGKIAVVGLGFRLPGGSKTPSELWNQLLQGFDGVSVVTKDRWSSTYNDSDMINNKYGGFINMNEWKSFDSLFFGISPKEAPLIDPQQRILLTLVWEALEDAGISPSLLRGSDTGVFMGVSNHDYMKIQYKDVSEQSPYAMTGSNASIISNRISYCYDFRGPSLTVDTACSSSLASVSLGLQSIANGDCKVAICGGVNALLDPSTSVAFSSLGVLNPDGRCKTFDADANGYVRGEGAGIVILKSLEEAEKDNNRIYGVILGSSMNEDGSYNKSSLTTPSGESQSENIERALSKSELPASDVYYVECHGTGTPVGDPIEVGALSSVFTTNHSQDSPLKVGSFKTNIGHLESAAGVASLIKSSLMLKNRMLVPSIHFNNPNPKIPFDQYHIQVVNQIEEFPDDKLVNIGINSFGFGGANCHLIIQEYSNQNLFDEIDSNSLSEDKYYMVPLSANSSYSLDKYEQEVKDNTNYHRMISFQEFALHQSTMKSHLLQRKVVIAKNWKEYLEQTNPPIINVLSSNDSNTSQSSNTIPVCFVFVGQGPQWNGMGRKLYETEREFRDTVDICDQMLKKYTGYSVWEKINSIKEDDQITINTPIVAQPALFLIQMGLIALYQKFGIHPSMVIGHSFGEVTAAYCSGAISLESAIKIVYYRSLLQNQTIGSGKMLAVSLSSISFAEKYGNDFEDLEIACYNAPDSIVVTGKEDRLKKLVTLLSKEGVFNAFLKSPCSFHSSSQKVIKEQVLESLSDLPSTFNTLIPLFSTVYGDLQTTPVDAKYIYNNLRKPVHFEKAIDNLTKYTKSNQYKRMVYLEITPHPTLAYLINKCESSGLKTNVISSLHRSKDELLTFYSSVASLHCQGVNVNFGSQFNSALLSSPLWKEVTNILPRYQWENDTQYWNESLYSHDLRLKGPTIDLIGWKKHSNGQESFETIIDVKKNCYAYLKDHKVRGKPIFPGAGYIDIILEAVEHLEKHGGDQLQAAHTSILIQSIEFQSPFFLIEGEQQHLQTTIDTISKNVYQFQFFQKDTINQKKWTKICKAKIQLNPQSSNQIMNDTILHSLTTVPSVDLQEIKKKVDVCCIDRSDLYQRIVRLGLGYGPYFQMIQKLWVGSNFDSLALLNFDKNDRIQKHRTNYKRVFNSMVLDNCFHGVLGILEENNQHYVVERVDKMQVYPQVLFNQVDKIDQLYLYTRILNPNVHSTQIHASCQLIDQDGHVVVEVARFTLSSLEKYKVSSIKKPSNQVYTINWQAKESPLPTPKSIVSDPMTELHDKSQILVDQDFVNYCSLLVKESLETIPGWDWTMNSMTLQQYMSSLNIDASFTRFVSRLFEIFSLVPSLEDYKIFSPIDLKSKVFSKYPDAVLEIELVERATSIIPGLIQGDSTACHCLFENDLLGSFYTTSTAVTYYLEQLASTVQNIIQSLSKPSSADQDMPKKVFKILEVGGGTGSLTLKLLDKLATVFQDIPYEKCPVEVVYTFTDISASFINSEMQSKCQKVIAKSNGSIKMVYKTLNLEMDYVNQSFLTSDYDCIVMSYVLHAVSDLGYGIRQLYEMLAPNGWLMFIEPTPKMVFSDIVFGCFHQWWQFSDEYRTDHCSIRPSEWTELLCNQIGGFKYPLSFLNFEEKQVGVEDHSFVVHAQKQSISEFRVSRDSVSYCSMVVPRYATLNGRPTNGNQSPTIEGHKSLISKYLRDGLLLCQEKVDVIETETLRNPSLQDEKSIENSLSRSGITFFLAGIDTLNGNYQAVTYQLTKLFQIVGSMTERGMNVPKIVVVTKCAQRSSRNYLNASLVGLTRTAMNEYSNLQIYSIDIEEEDTADLAFIIKLISMNMSDKEYIVKKDGTVLVPRLFQNERLLEPIDPTKSQIAFETNIDKLYCKSKQSLEYQFCVLPDTLGQDEIEIQVQAVGVNFKDNLFYKGLLPQDIFRKGDIYNPPFGLECSGIITRVGSSAANQWKVGDKVVGFARHSLASHVTTSQYLVVKKPDTITFEEAASLPVVYCTAFHSLFKVNRMDVCGEETALIHSATGGVGLACLNLLKMNGAKDGSVYATVGSKDKKNYLLQHYGSMISHIYSTRDKEFATALQGKIDCLVNTLSGEFTQSNFQSMSSFGRIADLSVTHIYANEPLDMGNFKGDIQYCGVDLERLIDEKPKQLQSILQSIVDWIAEGKLAKIPIEIYSSDRSKEAIESLGERGHIGKIIINCTDILHQQQQKFAEKHGKKVLEVPKSKYHVDLKDTVIITGQTGISLQIISWLIEHSKVSHIIVLSKSSLKWKLEKIIKEPHNRLVNIDFACCDVSMMENLSQVVKAKLVGAPPVRAVFHLAAVYDDVPITNVTPENITNVHNPKVLGAINLHRLSIINCWKLSHFILFSSITGVIGYYDQAAYNSANSVLDSLANFRRQAGLPALAVNWGPIETSGKVAESEAIQSLFASRGLPVLSLGKFLGGLEGALNLSNVLNNSEGALNLHQLIVTPITNSLFYDSFQHMRPKLEHLMYAGSERQKSGSSSNDSSIGGSMQKENITSENVLEKLTCKVSELLSINKSKLNVDTKLKDYGLDSLLTVQFKGWVDKEFDNKNLFSHIQLSSSSINSLVEKIIESQGPQQKKSSTPSKRSPSSTDSPLINGNIIVGSNTPKQQSVPVSSTSSPIANLSLRSKSSPMIQLPMKQPKVSISSPTTAPSITCLIPPRPNSVGLPGSNGDKSPFISSSSAPSSNKLALPTSATNPINRRLSSMLSPGLMATTAPTSNNNPYILGIGTAVPNDPLKQSELAAVMSKDFSDDPIVIDKVEKIFEQSQIHTRYLYRNPLIEKTALRHRKNENINDVNSQFQKCAPDLAQKACERAIKDWGGNIQDITHIVSVSSTGVVVPDINFVLIQRLGLNKDVERLSVNFMGCLAGLSSMRAAVPLASKHPKNRVLVVCTEICSTHFSTKEGVDQIVASTIFADGSAAYILGCNPSIYERPLFEVVGAMTRSVPDTAHTMTWDISVDGWDLGLDQSIPHHIGGGIESFVNDLLAKCKNQTQELSASECEFLIHTGGKAILMSIEQSLGITSKQNQHSWDIYRNYGNMSSASVIFVLEHARHSKSLPQYSVSLAFGPGLAFEGCLLKNMI